MCASVPTHQYSTLSLVPRNRECFKTRDTSIGLFWNADDGIYSNANDRMYTSSKHGTT